MERISIVVTRDNVETFETLHSVAEFISPHYFMAVKFLSKSF